MLLFSQEIVFFLGSFAPGANVASFGNLIFLLLKVLGKFFIVLSPVLAVDFRLAPVGLVRLGASSIHATSSGENCSPVWILNLFRICSVCCSERGGWSFASCLSWSIFSCCLLKMSAISLSLPGTWMIFVLYLANSKENLNKIPEDSLHSLK